MPNCSRGRGRCPSSGLGDPLTACLDADSTYICTAYSSRCYIIQKVRLTYVIDSYLCPNSWSRKHRPSGALGLLPDLWASAATRDVAGDVEEAYILLYAS